MNWFPNGSSLSSVLSGNVGTSTYGIKPDNAPSETISGGFGYGTLFAVCGRGDEGYGYGYAIYSGSNATGSRVFATYDRDFGWSERVSKSDLSKKWTIGTKITSTCKPSTDAGTSFNTVPFKIIAENPTNGEVAGIGFELNKVVGGALYLASDRNLYFMLNNGTSYKIQMEEVKS